MAIGNRKDRNTKDFAKAEAWLDLELVTADGSVIKLPKNLAMYLKDNVSEQMVSHAKANPDFIFKLQGKVRVVDDAPKPAIKF